jgi:histidine triad (HIT) family protein
MEMSEEDLKNMSPEQIAELQKKNCIFCHIVSGRVASKKIYEDDRCIGILDINPANPGHILLLPKEHYQIMPLVPEDLVSHLFIIAKQLSQAQLKSLKSQGTTILIANGLVAGQRAPHFMIHVIPRKDNDGVGFSYPTTHMNEGDRKKLSATLRKRIGAVFGLAAKEIIDMDSKPAKIGTPTVEADFEDVKDTQEPTDESPEKNTQQEAPEEKAPEPAQKPKKDKAPKKPREPKKKAEPTDNEQDKSSDKSSDSRPDLDLISRLF